MRDVTLPKSPIEALHVSGHTSDVRKTRMPTERSVSEYPKIIINFIVSILHFRALCCEREDQPTIFSQFSRSLFSFFNLPSISSSLRLLLSNLFQLSHQIILSDNILQFKVQHSVIYSTVCRREFKEFKRVGCLITRKYELAS